MSPMDSSALPYLDGSWLLPDNFPDLFDINSETDDFPGSAITSPDLFDTKSENEGISRNTVTGSSLTIPSNSGESCMSKVDRVVGGIGNGSPQFSMAALNAVINANGGVFASRAPQSFSHPPYQSFQSTRTLPSPSNRTLPIPSNSGESCLSKVEQVCGVVGGGTPQHSMTAINPTPNSASASNNSISSMKSSHMADHHCRAMLLRTQYLAGIDMKDVVNSRPKRRNVKISKDPQSVAARLRRERISDRIRILQSLVPGGTKMDTASMLDEAIAYVKLLQQQLRNLANAAYQPNPGFDSRQVFPSSALYLNSRMAGLPHDTMGMGRSTVSHGAASSRNDSRDGTLLSLIPSV